MAIVRITRRSFDAVADARQQHKDAPRSPEKGKSRRPRRRCLDFSLLIGGTRGESHPPAAMPPAVAPEAMPPARPVSQSFTPEFLYVHYAPPAPGRLRTTSSGIAVA